MNQASVAAAAANLYILISEGSVWRQLTKAMITRPPISILKTRMLGWRDIGVSVNGGGAKPHIARLRFNGRRYPGNPTVPPAIALPGRPVGSTVIAE